MSSTPTYKHWEMSGSLSNSLTFICNEYFALTYKLISGIIIIIMSWLFNVTNELILKIE